MGNNPYYTNLHPLIRYKFIEKNRNDNDEKLTQNWETDLFTDDPNLSSYRDVKRLTDLPTINKTNKVQIKIQLKLENVQNIDQNRV